jgi:LAO/AO transport system kinase
MNEAEQLASGVLAGERRALSRAITLLESERGQDEATASALLDELVPHAGQSLRLGVSGPPGVGKSTLIDALGLLALARGRRVAVLAVDPSSQKTGGSILGDKTRMARLAADARSFIRPSASRGERGGVAPRTREAILACEAAGFDLVVIETVGVGQAEIDVAELVDCLLVLLAGGAGDELQGMKRGLLEHADLFAVTKADGADRERAERAATELGSALALLGGAARVLTSSAQTGEGMLELLDAIEAFSSEALRSGALETRRRQQNRAWFARAVERGLRRQLLADGRLAALEAELGDAAERGELTPWSAARQLLGELAASATRT